MTPNLTDAEPFDLIKAMNEAAIKPHVDIGPPVIILDMSRWLQLGREFSKLERELKAERKRSEILEGQLTEAKRLISDFIEITERRQRADATLLNTFVLRVK